MISDFLNRYVTRSPGGSRDPAESRRQTDRKTPLWFWFSGEGVKVLMIDALQARRAAGRGSSAVHLDSGGATV